MHNAPVIVLDAEVVDEFPVVFVEVVLLAGFHVLHVDIHVLITVRSCLLVVEAHSVAQLVHDGVMLYPGIGKNHCDHNYKESMIIICSYFIIGIENYVSDDINIFKYLCLLISVFVDIYWLYVTYVNATIYI